MESMLLTARGHVLTEADLPADLVTTLAGTALRRSMCRG
jgi:hypothetical protein